MSQMKPPSRPALRKSVDAALHPALAGRGGLVSGPNRPDAEATSADTPLAKAGTTPKRGAPANVSGGPVPSVTGRGKGRRGTTSDALRPTKQDPATKLTLSIPKSLRKRLRSQAKSQGVEPELLAVRILAESLR